MVVLEGQDFNELQRLVNFNLANQWHITVHVIMTYNYHILISALVLLLLLILLAPFFPIEVKALLLSDILVLLNNPEDSDKLILKQYHIEPIGVGEVREEISPVIRVKEMILRHYATDKGNDFNDYPCQFIFPLV